MHSSLINERLSRNGNEWFRDVYGDIADVTPIEGWWRARDLVGELRTIERYSAKYQLEIIGCVLTRMVALRAPEDGLERRGQGEYQWRISPK